MFQFRTNNESDREDGGLCSSSEQTMRVTGRMVGCVPVQNKQ